MDATMNFAAVLTDDQTAVIGCFVAIIACTLIAALSFRFGPAGRSISAGPAIPMTRTEGRNDTSQQRRAA